MKKRSLKASKQGIQRLSSALLQAKQSKLALAEKLGIARSTVSNLFSGRSIAYEKLIQICEALSLDWQEIAALTIADEYQEENQQDNTNVDALVKEVREKVRSSIEERCDTMRVLDMSHPIGLSDIYTNVNILEKITGRRHKEIAELMQECSSEDFERFGMGRITQERVLGLDAVEKYAKLIILGKPGAGKTTFLKYVALQCNVGKFQDNYVPVFVTLKDFAEAAKKLELLEYINQQFASCGIAATQVVSLLKQGKVLVLLDGLDEVREDDIHHVLKEIRDFSNHFRDNRFIITCRNAAQEYTFEKFTEVEIADFEQTQILAFSTNWFTGKPGREKFVKRLRENNRINEIATSPLLLTLLCLVFEESGTFPKSRSQLYKEGLDTLLKKWDAKRGIERDQVYKNISPQRKEELLSKIALTTFEQGNYFFKQKVAEKYITDYICNLLSANTDPKALQLDSEAILRSIEAQHGLLVERAKGIYSFSHLTFHEYLTAVEIVSRTNPLEKALKERLVPHIVEPRWREVFLLAVELLSNADELLLLMKNKIDGFLSKDDYLQDFLREINEKSTSTEIFVDSKLAAVRAFYFDIDFTIDQNRLLGEHIDQRANNVLVCASFLSRVLKETSLHAAIALAKKYDADHERSITNAPSANYVMDVALKIVLNSKQLKTGVREKLQEVRENLYQGDSEEEKVKQLADKSRTVAKNNHQMGKDWHFNDDQKELMKQYYNANLLLISCLKTDCYVNLKLRKEIEDTLLLPIDEVEGKNS